MHEGGKATSSCVSDLRTVQSPLATFCWTDADEDGVAEEEEVHRHRIGRLREALNYLPRSGLAIFSFQVGHSSDRFDA